MTIDDDYVRLLWRAETLRRCAVAIDAALVDRLVAFAGDDTWLGPTADAFVLDMRRARALVVEAETVVRAAATRLQALADRLRQEQIRAGLRS